METKKLSLQEMEMVEGGQKNWGCAATGGLIVTVWAVGFGIVNPLDCLGCWIWNSKSVSWCSSWLLRRISC